MSYSESNNEPKWSVLYVTDGEISVIGPFPLHDEALAAAVEAQARNEISIQDQHVYLIDADHTMLRLSSSDIVGPALEFLVAAINDHGDDSFSVKETSESRYALRNGEDEITEGYDFEVASRLRQIAKENGVQLYPEDHLQSMNTVEDIIKHDPLGLLGDDD